ncbi:MAG: M28 family metallopeptidase [Planctomycetota bacterium]
MKKERTALHFSPESLFSVLSMNTDVYETLEICDLDRAFDGLLRAPESLLSFIADLDAIGPRLIGSEGERKAQAFLRDRLQSLGLEVTFDEFDVKTYTRGTTEVVLHVGGEDKTLDGLSRVYSPPTEGLQRFELLDLGRGEEADFERAGDRVAGRAVFVSHVCPKKYQKALALGASAYLEPSPDKEDAIFLGCMPPGGEIPNIPRVKLSASSGRAIVEAARGGPPLEISLRLTGETLPSTSGNLVATLHGRTGLPEIVIGAHMDTFTLSPGSVDNATGIAVVYEIARILARLPRLRRTVRFVFFTGEEVGRLGSIRYAGQNIADPASVGAYFNFDVPVGGDLVLHVQAGEKEGGYWNELRETLDDPFDFIHILRRNSDHYSFYRRGIPCIMMRANARPGQENTGDFIHSRLDTIDKVNPEELHRSARLSGRITLHLAEAKALPFGPFEPAPDRADLYDDT